MICDVKEGPQKETTECPGGAVSPSPGDPGFGGEREHLHWNMDALTPSLYSGGTWPLRLCFHIPTVYKPLQRKDHRYCDCYV